MKQILRTDVREPDLAAIGFFEFASPLQSLGQVLVNAGIVHRCV